MKGKRLKTNALLGLLAILIISTMLLTSFLKTKLKNDKKSNNMTYVSGIILDKEIAVINDTTTKIINPYTDMSVTIGKNFYDYKADQASQEKSIIFHNDTYIQNSGIDFVSENEFDVISVLNGTVINVKDDETLGKIVEVKHDNNYVSIYQSLKEVNVKKGDIVKQGQILGKSGTNELDKEIGNHLHFEMYINGQIVNPSLYLNKEIKTKEEKGN